MIEKYLTHLQCNWRTVKGLVITCLLILAAVNSLTLIPRSWIFSLCFTLLLIFCWLVLWSVLSGRIVFYSSKMTIILCIEADWDGYKNYNRTITKIFADIRSYNLFDKIRIKTAGHDLIKIEKDAQNYCETRNTDLIFWGNTEYGYLDNEKRLIFNLNFYLNTLSGVNELDDSFSEILEVIKNDTKLDIADKNELYEYRIVAENITDIILFITALHFYKLNNFKTSYYIITKLYELSLKNDNFEEIDDLSTKTLLLLDLSAKLSER